MMIKIFFYSLILGLFLILFSSCGDGCTDAKKDFFWSQDKSIITRVDSFPLGNDSLVAFIDYNIISGSSNVFEVRFTGEFCEDVLDSGGGSRFAFVVPVDSTETFTYSDLELNDALAFYEVFGFACCAGYVIEGGEIRGRRTDDDSWQVSIDVVTTPQDTQFGAEPLNFIIDEEFSLE